MKNFLATYEKTFNGVPILLNQLLRFPDITAEVEGLVPLTQDQLYTIQTDWLALVRNLENPMDYEFFKESWVPITRNSLDYYIDLGSDEFQIFMVDFFWLEPYGWYKKMIIPNFAWFLLISNESDFDSKEYVKAIRGWGQKPVTDFFNPDNQ